MFSIRWVIFLHIFFLYFTLSEGSSQKTSVNKKESLKSPSEIISIWKKTANTDLWDFDLAVKTPLGDYYKNLSIRKQKKLKPLFTKIYKQEIIKQIKKETISEFLILRERIHDNFAEVEVKIKFDDFGTPGYLTYKLFKKEQWKIFFYYQTGKSEIEIIKATQKMYNEMEKWLGFETMLLYLERKAKGEKGDDIINDFIKKGLIKSGKIH
jgi:ABC-type transporter MlaC component